MKMFYIFINIFSNMCYFCDYYWFCQDPVIIEKYLKDKKYLFKYFI